MREFKVKIDAESWNTGYIHGYHKQISKCPVKMDELSYSSGYIEGKAHKEQGKKSEVK